MEGHDELIIRKSDSEEGGLEDDNQAVLDELGYNADLYIANQEVVHDWSFWLMYWWLDYLSLSSIIILLVVVVVVVDIYMIIE